MVEIRKNDATELLRITPDGQLVVSDPALKEALLKHLQPAHRVIYNLQLGNGRLCEALRKIAEGCPDPETVAKKALANKAPWETPMDEAIAMQQRIMRRYSKTMEYLRQSELDD